MVLTCELPKVNGAPRPDHVATGDGRRRAGGRVGGGRVGWRALVPRARRGGALRLGRRLGGWRRGLGRHISRQRRHRHLSLGEFRAVVPGAIIEGVLWAKEDSAVRNPCDTGRATPLRRGDAQCGWGVHSPAMRRCLAARVHSRFSPAVSAAFSLRHKQTSSAGKMRGAGGTWTA
eukprot:4208178-Prymnesium_polylepis.1